MAGADPGAGPGAGCAMAALKVEAAEKSAALVRLQRGRVAERHELLQTQQALKEALEHLDEVSVHGPLHVTSRVAA